ncbi:MAG: hypothetical protein R3C56_21930 [Pirellulaceae bacterium]
MADTKLAKEQFFRNSKRNCLSAMAQLAVWSDFRHRPGANRLRPLWNLLDIEYDWSRIEVPKRLSDFEQMWTRRYEPLRFSGVWRFHELLPFAPADKVVTVGEGQTLLQRADEVAKFVGMDAVAVPRSTKE